MGKTTRRPGGANAAGVGDRARNWEQKEKEDETHPLAASKQFQEVQKGGLVLIREGRRGGPPRARSVTGGAALRQRGPFTFAD